MHGMRCAATSGFAGKRISNATFYSMPWNPGERICNRQAKRACKTSVQSKKVPLMFRHRTAPLRSFDIRLIAPVP
ncbi:hypothetical protein BIFPSEUDO_03325 [Bifidobacterium pseudocatenulatum DSM 20438 = JCM 1200 = LMG 10505]|uniref:Uncharacterized protein n=1 Tax=Bifidobacterium pseudocatenulatum DSM 20438 = JCM 1200 = LMG 10505 TaxID=547043 RepID=C0BRR1_BIFPS|nr:hypothetical protein BIFPSEUDO_03325 [Bifidobacterium pseudocatenulatum DSM 20438 = JCM 1200 = LMG 10505]